MKRYLFIVLFFLPTLLSAQTNSWFSNDQQWYYNYTVMPYSGFEELTVTGTEEINSFNCIEVESRRKLQFNETTTYDIDPSGGDISQHYVYEQNDSVFYYDSINGEFDLMYDFNMEVGDRMTVLSSFEVGLYGDSIALEIDSSGVMDIGGGPLRFQRVNLLILESGFSELLGQTYIFEKMGVVNLAQDYYSSHLVLKLAITSYGLFETSRSFRCYSDNNISYLPFGDWCDMLPEGNWLAQGASWCYRTNTTGGVSEKRISLSGRVVFPENNPPLLWKALQETRHNNSGTTSVHLDSFYLYERNAKLYRVSPDLGTTKILFDLKWEAGDIIPVPESGCDESYIIVDSIGQVVMDAVPLRKLYCTAVLMNSSDFSRSFEITSRLGSFDLDISNSLQCATDSNPYHLVYYSDFQINPNPEECFTIHVSNDELLIQSDIHISPNPGADFIHVQNDGGIREIKIMDVSGKIIQVISKDFNTLDIRHFPNGIYFLNIMTQGDGFVVKKIIKH